MAMKIDDRSTHRQRPPPGPILALPAAPDDSNEDCMPDLHPQRIAPRLREGLSREERRSFTHGEFWIPEAEREKYKRALQTLNHTGVPYVVAGAYAIHEYTGIYRETKDLDVFVEPEQVIAAARALREAGFTTRLEQAHWLAKAKLGEHFIDLIYGMGNGIALIDREWYRYSAPAILAAIPVRVAPPEELIWHRLFISERHRQDMADIVHLILCVGDQLDWRRLLEKAGPNWPLLLAQLQVYLYVYPHARDRVPNEILTELLDRAREELENPSTSLPEGTTRGTLISFFSFAIDVNEWGFRDLRAEQVRRMERLPIIREIATADVWDERAEPLEHFIRRIES
jgi:hypothetical protein